MIHRWHVHNLQSSQKNFCKPSNFNTTISESVRMAYDWQLLNNTIKIRILYPSYRHKELKKLLDENQTWWYICRSVRQSSWSTAAGTTFSPVWTSARTPTILIFLIPFLNPSWQMPAEYQDQVTTTSKSFSVHHSSITPLDDTTKSDAGITTTKQYVQCTITTWRE